MDNSPNYEGLIELIKEWLNDCTNHDEKYWEELKYYFDYLEGTSYSSSKEMNHSSTA